MLGISLQNKKNLGSIRILKKKDSKSQLQVANNLYRKEVESEPIQRIKARWKEIEQKNLSSEAFDTWKGSEIVEKVKLSLVIFSHVTQNNLVPGAYFIVDLLKIDFFLL